MRPGLGVALTALALMFAGPALSQISFFEPPPAASAPPPGCDNGCGGAGNLLPRDFSQPGGDAGAAPTRIFAVVGQHLVSGYARPDRSRPAGALTLTDTRDPAYVCAGLYGRAKHGGPTVDLRCSDGARVRLTARPTMEGAGLARSSAAGSPAVLAYGYRASRAAKRLAAPAGFVLVADGRDLRLERAGS